MTLNKSQINEALKQAQLKGEPVDEDVVMKAIQHIDPDMNEETIAGIIKFGRTDISLEINLHIFQGIQKAFAEVRAERIRNGLPPPDEAQTALQALGEDRCYEIFAEAILMSSKSTVN